VSSFVTGTANFSFRDARGEREALLPILHKHTHSHTYTNTHTHTHTHTHIVVVLVLFVAVDIL